MAVPPVDRARWAVRHHLGVPTLRIAQDDAADEMLARDPLALLLGMLFDQHMRQRSSATLADRPATSFRR
jgi:hypothetical protein